jgi:ATP-dependent helicase/nuclease subunit A
LAIRELTADQRGALGVEGASVALSAGAGSGKTLVLAERFVQALAADKPVPIGAIVAVTFTEKAARELKERIRRECRGRLRSHSGSARRREDAARFWRRVERGLEAASISTFHSFCANLLRAYPIESGVEPGFAILDEVVAPALRSEAIEGCFHRWLADERRELLELAVPAGIAKVHQIVTHLVAHYSGRELAEWGEQSADQILDWWKTVWRDEVLALAASDFAAAVDRNLRTIVAHPCRAPKARERIAWLAQTLHDLDRFSFEPEGLDQVLEATSLRGARPDHWLSEDHYQQVKAAMHALRNAVHEARALFDWSEPSTRAAIEQGRLYARLSFEASEAYSRLKRDQGLLDYGDLQESVRTLFTEGSPEVIEEIRSGVSLILVDEFQDTDPTQTDILSRLSGESATTGKLFLVGDAKQSIYAFRGARPDLFHEFRERFPVEGRRSLSDNFRSRPEILHFVNALFLETLAAEVDALRANRVGIGPAEDADCPVEMHWSVPRDPGGNVPSRRENRRKEEARWLARYLRRRLDGGWMISDRETGIQRRADAGDIVFLFRSLTDVSAYERALLESGLDYYVVKGTAFFLQQEVIDLVNVLTAIEDPLDPLALAGVLRSPFFGLSDEVLYWLSTAAGGVCGGLARAESISGMSARDRVRAIRARAMLGSWHEAKDRTSIARLLERVLDESGYEAALLAEPLGERKRANCRKLVRQARRYDSHAGMTIAQFVARLKADLQSPPREDQAATTDEQGTVIRLMTIHQAKGLEFPIVVLPDLNRGEQPERNPAVFHSKLGVIVRSGGLAEEESDDTEDPVGPSDDATSLGIRCWKALAAREREAETMRLFYVAATRARDFLILSADLPGPPAEDSAKLSPALALLTSRFDCSTGACRAALPPGWPAPQFRVVQAAGDHVESGPIATRRQSHARGAVALAVRAIECSLAAASVDKYRPPVRAEPRVRNLNLDHRAILRPGQREIERLIRGMVIDAAFVDADAERLEHLAEQAARGMQPRPSRLQCSRAAHRARFLASHPELRQMACLDQLARAARWSLNWSDPRVADRENPQWASPLLLQGGIELAARHEEGSWWLFSIHLKEENDIGNLARLRLLAGARALGATDLVRGQVLWLKPDGSVEAENVAEVTDGAIQKALEAVLED